MYWTLGEALGIIISARAPSSAHPPHCPQTEDCSGPMRARVKIRQWQVSGSADLKHPLPLWAKQHASQGLFPTQLTSPMFSKPGVHKQTISLVLNIWALRMLL